MQWILSLGQAAVILVVALAASPASTEEAELQSLHDRLEARLAEPDALSSPEQIGAVTVFYERRDYAPVWLDRSGLNDNGRLILETLRGSSRHGLNPADYDLWEIAERLESGDSNRLVELDVLMTGAVLSYCFDIRSGRASPRDADPEWFVEADGIDHLAALEESQESVIWQKSWAG